MVKRWRTAGPGGYAHAAQFLTAAAIVVVAFALRLHRIGVEEFWLDEAFSFQDVTTPGWPAGIRFKDVPPLYPILLRGWMALAGDSETALRLLSALCGTLFVAAVMVVGRAMFNHGVGLWSGVWAALSPMHVYYSQEARAYALLTLLLAATYGLAWRATERDRWRDWALVSASAAAALYTHYLAIFALVPTLAIVVCRPPCGRRAFRWAAALGAALVLFLPWIVWDFVVQPHAMGGLDWVKPMWERTPPMLAIPKSLELLQLGSQKGSVPIWMKQLDTIVYPPGLRVVGIAVLSLIAVWTVVPWGESRTFARRVAALWVLVLAPLIALWAISWIRPVYLVGRYDQLAFPASALLLGVGFDKLWRVLRYGPLLAGLAALALLVPVGAKLVLFYRQPAQDRARSRLTAQALVERVADGDVVVFTGFRDALVTFQLVQLGYRLQDGYCVSSAARKRFACRSFTAATGAGSPHARDHVAALGREGGSIWVVMGSNTPTDARFLDELVEIGFRRVGVDRGLAIMEYQQPWRERGRG